MKLGAQPDGGKHPAPLNVRLAVEPAEFAIRYTLDGMVPVVYKQPIEFAKPGLYEIRFRGTDAQGRAMTPAISRLYDVR